MYYEYNADFCGKSINGLKPHEILMLSYAEKYSAKKAEPALFWENQYNVDNVYTLINSLTSRGFFDGVHLTELGKQEVEKNSWVLDIHRGKITDFSLAEMSRLVEKTPELSINEIIWNEYCNRLNIERNNKNWQRYRNIKASIADFTIKQKRYDAAIQALSEVCYYDINVLVRPWEIENDTVLSSDIIQKLDQCLYAEHISDYEYIEYFVNQFSEANMCDRILPTRQTAEFVIAYMRNNSDAVNKFMQVISQKCKDIYSNEYDGTLNLDLSNIDKSSNVKSKKYIHIVIEVIKKFFGISLCLAVLGYITMIIQKEVSITEVLIPIIIFTVLAYLLLKKSNK